MEDKQKKPRKVYADTLSGMIVLQALIEFTHEVAEGKITDNRSQFDAILCRVHNAAAPENQQKAASYFAEPENSLRVSQKFSQIKTKMKDAGEEIHISLPRRSRSFGAKQLATLKQNDAWASFATLNKAARNKKVHGKK
jgi:hypothetical protein